MSNDEILNNELPEEEPRDLLEVTTEDGDTMLLEIQRYFFYNGEEYCLLYEAEEDPEACEGCECETCEGCDQAVEADDEDDEETINAYIMHINVTEENGEEVEEFEMVEDEALMDKLIKVVEADFADDSALED